MLWAVGWAVLFGSSSRAVRRHPTRRTALTKRARGRTRQADVELLLGAAVAGRSLRMHSTSMVSCGRPAGGGYRPARFFEPQGCTQNAIRVVPASKRRSVPVYSERQRNRRPNARLFPPSGLSHVTLNPTYMPLAPLPPDAQQYPSLATPYIAPVLLKRKPGAAPTPPRQRTDKAAGTDAKLFFWAEKGKHNTPRSEDEDWQEICRKIRDTRNSF